MSKVLLINGSPHARGCTAAALGVVASVLEPDCLRQNHSVSQRILSDKKMDDKQAIEALYKQMYRAMIAKDTAALNQVHADEFVLTHMTGMRQPKPVYIQSIANGTLNYYSADDDSIVIEVNGDRATMIGRSCVNAAVFGGGRHTWQLQLRFQLVKRDGRWLFTAASASTY